MGHVPRHDREQGQTLVVSLLFLTVLVGFAALLIDAGSWYWMKRNMQGDADVAALAAVRDLPTGGADVASATARDYAEVKNAGDDGTMEDFDVDMARMTATVVVGRNAESPFGKLYGISNTDVRATATAQISQINQVHNLLPFAALENTLEFGNPPIPERITVSPGQGQDQGIQTGHIGAIAPEHSAPDCDDGNGNSASELERLIQGSYTSTGLVGCGTPIGDTMETSTGDRPNAIRDGFNLRFGSNDGTHTDLFDDVLAYDNDLDRYIVEKPESPRIGFIPVVSTGPGIDDWDDISGTSQPVTVIDYVMVYIGRLGSAGEPAYVRGNQCTPNPCQGQQIQVFLTPIRGVVTPDFDYETSEFWDADSNAPLSISLIR